MPELPELRHMVATINAAARNGERLFRRVEKSAVHKLENLALPAPGPFTLTSQARGKEIRLTVSSAEGDAQGHFLFAMGMSGTWKAFDGDPASLELPKHAHLSFVADDGVLCFVDVRRFGTWRRLDSATEWGLNRGPDPVDEHDEFKELIQAQLASGARVLQKPICEVLLDQSLFNGIGNYLRAEILHRAGVAPFARAHDVLADPQKGAAVLRECRDVPAEVIASKELSYFDGETNWSFQEWLQVYGKGSWAEDANRRRVWFRGVAGPLLKAGSKRGIVRSQSEPDLKRAKPTKPKRADTEPDLEPERAKADTDLEPKRAKPRRAKTEPDLERELAKAEPDLEPKPTKPKRAKTEPDLEPAMPTKPRRAKSEPDLNYAKPTKPKRAKTEPTQAKTGPHPRRRTRRTSATTP